MGKINNSFKISRNKLNIVPSQKKKKEKNQIKEESHSKISKLQDITFQGIYMLE